MNLPPMTLEEIDAQLAALAEGVELREELKQGSLEEVDAWLTELSEGVSEVKAEALGSETPAQDAAGAEAPRDAASDDPEAGAAAPVEEAIEVDVEDAEAAEETSDDAGFEDIPVDIGTDEIETIGEATEDAPGAAENLQAALTPSDMAELAALNIGRGPAPQAAPESENEDLIVTREVGLDEFDDDEEESTALFTTEDLEAIRASVAPPAADDSVELEIDMDDLVEIDMDDLEIVEEDAEGDAGTEGEEGEGGEKKGFFKKIFG
ncbi:MAG: hypothetical protein AAF645_11615 [Myxococcota bacterium]